MRRFLADTCAMVVFSIIAGMFIEVVISRMTIEQSIQARLIAIPFNLITARPYGIFRDWIFRIMRTTEAGAIKQGLTDIVAFTCFQVPFYALILTLAGATITQTITACTTASLVIVFMGRPYGIFLDFVRALFGIRQNAVVRSLHD